jgi:hypothetical protein
MTYDEFKELGDRIFKAIDTFRDEGHPVDITALASIFVWRLGVMAKPRSRQCST